MMFSALSGAPSWPPHPSKAGTGRCHGGTTGLGGSSGGGYFDMILFCLPLTFGSDGNSCLGDVLG